MYVPGIRLGGQGEVSARAEGGAGARSVTFYTTTSPHAPHTHTLERIPNTLHPIFPTHTGFKYENFNILEWMHNLARAFDNLLDMLVRRLGLELGLGLLGHRGLPHYHIAFHTTTTPSHN